MQDIGTEQEQDGAPATDLRAAREKAKRDGQLGELEVAEILDVVGDDVDQIDAVITDLARNEVKVEGEAAVEEEEPEEEEAELEKVLDAEGTAGRRPRSHVSA